MAPEGSSTSQMEALPQRQSSLARRRRLTDGPCTTWEARRRVRDLWGPWVPANPGHCRACPALPGRGGVNRVCDETIF
jgi:hypothetical protein